MLGSAYFTSYIGTPRVPSPWLPPFPAYLLRFFLHTGFRQLGLLPLPYLLKTLYTPSAPHTRNLTLATPTPLAVPPALPTPAPTCPHPTTLHLLPYLPPPPPNTSPRYLQDTIRSTTLPPPPPPPGWGYTACLHRMVYSDTGRLVTFCRMPASSWMDCLLHGGSTALLGRGSLGFRRTPSNIPAPPARLPHHCPHPCLTTTHMPHTPLPAVLRTVPHMPPYPLPPPAMPSSQDWGRGRTTTSHSPCHTSQDQPITAHFTLLHAPHLPAPYAAYTLRPFPAATDTPPPARTTFTATTCYHALLGCLPAGYQATPTTATLPTCPGRVW